MRNPCMHTATPMQRKIKYAKEKEVDEMKKKKEKTMCLIDCLKQKWSFFFIRICIKKEADYMSTSIMYSTKSRLALFMR